MDIEKGGDISERACATSAGLITRITIITAVIMAAGQEPRFTHPDKTDESDTSSHTSDSGLSVGCSISIQPSVPCLPPPPPGSFQHCPPPQLDGWMDGWMEGEVDMWAKTGEHRREGKSRRTPADDSSMHICAYTQRRVWRRYDTAIAQQQQQQQQQQQKQPAASSRPPARRESA